MQDLNDKITGNTLTATEWNEVPSEIQNVIEALGQVLSSGDLDQLGKSIAGYIANANFYTDTGIADAYVLTKIGSKQAATAYTDGFQASFLAGNTNTGASTVNIAGLGIKNIIGSEVAGSINAGEYRDIKYRTSSGNFVLTPFNSRSVSYTPTGLGAVVGDVQTKLREIVSVKDFGAIGDGVTDDTAAIQAALDWATSGDGINGTGKLIFVPVGNYIISATLLIPSVTKFIGAGRWSTSLTAHATFTGTEFLTDKGSAAKIQIEHLRFHTINAATTIDRVIKLGYTIAFGTEGRIYEVNIRGGLNAASTNTEYGIDVVGNVAYIQNVTVEFCDNAFYEGPNSVSNAYNTCTSIGQSVYGFRTGTAARLSLCHVEAPETACIPYYTAKSMSMDGCVVSLGNDTIASIVQMASGALGVQVQGLVYLHANAGVATHILDDARAISSDNQYWADDATEQGQTFSFGDSRYQRVGNAGFLSSDGNGSPGLEGKSTKGAVYAEMIHDTKSVRIADGGSLDAFYPNPDNVTSLGYAARRWTEVFATNGTINTSDEREKRDIYELNEAEKAVAIELKSLIRKFKWKKAVLEKGDRARYHIGIMAQEVKKAFERHNLIANDYGMLCYDEWKDEETGEDKYIYSVRYEELLAFIVSTL